MVQVGLLSRPCSPSIYKWSQCAHTGNFLSKLERSNHNNADISYSFMLTLLLHNSEGPTTDSQEMIFGLINGYTHSNTQWGNLSVVNVYVNTKFDDFFFYSTPLFFEGHLATPHAYRAPQKNKL